MNTKPQHKRAVSGLGISIVQFIGRVVYAIKDRSENDNRERILKSLPPISLEEIIRFERDQKIH